MQQRKKTQDVLVFSAQKSKKEKIIVAVPRSNSTIIEFILGSSTSVSKIIHEPFIDFGYYNSEILSAYKKISTSINADNKADNKKEGMLLIKEMAHWLIRDDAYKIFLKSIDEPVILLIKNPYLSIESKIQKILQGVDRKERPGLTKLLLTSLPQRRNKNIQNSRDGLNFFAKKKGYNSWDKLVEKEAIQKRNLAMFSPIINYFVEKSTEDIWGWKDIDKIRQFLEKNKIKYKILEGIDFQLAPEATIRGLCETLNINFHRRMLHCSKNKFKKLIEQIQVYSIHWYETMLSSQEIIKPDIIPLSADKFPLFIQKYLSNTALPIYTRLCFSRHRLNVLDYSINVKHDRNSFQNYKTVDLTYFTVNKHMNYF